MVLCVAVIGLALVLDKRKRLEAISAVAGSVAGSVDGSVVDDDVVVVVVPSLRTLDVF